MSTRPKVATEQVPAEYYIGKKRWEKNRNSKSYLKIWKTYSESRKNGYAIFGKCELSPEDMFRRYGIHRPLNPKEDYPRPVALTPAGAKFGELRPSVIVTSAIDFRPTIHKDGRVTEWVTEPVLDHDGEFLDVDAFEVDVKSLYEGRWDEVETYLEELSLDIDLNRDKATVLHDLKNVIDYFYELRKKLGLKNRAQKKRRSKKIESEHKKKIHLTKQEKSVYAVVLLKGLGLSYREIAEIPKTPSKVQTALQLFGSWNNEERSKVQTYFQKMNNLKRVYMSESLMDADDDVDQE